MDEQIGQLDRGDAAHWNRLTLPHLFERNDLQLSKTGDRVRGPARAPTASCVTPAVASPTR